MRYERVLLTGAAGQIGSCLREGLRGEALELRLTDNRPIDDLADGESFLHADLEDAEGVARAVAGTQAVIHLGGVPDEAGFGVLTGPNLRLQRLRGRKAGRRSARGLRELEPDHRLLSGGPGARRERARPPRRPVRRDQGLRRGARAALRGQV